MLLVLEIPMLVVRIMIKVILFFHLLYFFIISSYHSFASLVVLWGSRNLNFSFKVIETLWVTTSALIENIICVTSSSFFILNWKVSLIFLLCHDPFAIHLRKVDFLCSQDKWRYVPVIQLVIIFRFSFKSSNFIIF